MIQANRPIAQLSFSSFARPALCKKGHNLTVIGFTHCDYYPHR